LQRRGSARDPRYTAIVPLISRISPDELYARRWQLLALTSVGAFMGPLDGSIVSVALPQMAPSLHLSFTASIWVQAVYLLVMAVLLIPLGRLADQRGRVHYYLAGITIFTAGSLSAALSMNAAWLIASRAVQGAGAALLGATSAAIVTAVFPPQERGRALGVNVTAVYLGLSVGPPLGGFLTDHLGWQSIFLVNLPIGIAVAGCGYLLLPRHERGDERGLRPDPIGTVLWGLTLVCVLVPLTFAAQWGWTSPRTLGLLGVAVVSAAAFVVAELRADDPMLDLDLLFHNRLFAAANAASLLNYMALGAISILTAVYLEVVQGRSASLTGWLMLAQPAMMAALSPFSGRLSDRVGSRVLSSVGMVIVAAGMLLLATLPTTSSLARVIVSLAVVGLGMAAFSAPNVSAIMGSVEKRQLGIASAFMGTTRVTGQALSVAVLGGIAASSLGPLGGRLLLTHGASVTGQSTAAAQVAATYVLHHYAHGYHYAMLTGAGLALVGALASLTRGQHVPATVAGGSRPSGEEARAGS
jgi:EmrB/QacA subfamily drug resistance transporter